LSIGICDANGLSARDAGKPRRARVAGAGSRARLAATVTARLAGHNALLDHA